MWEKKALTLGEGQQKKERAVANKVLTMLLAAMLALSLSACFKTNKAPTQNQTGTSNQSLGTTNSTADIDEWLVPLLSEYLADDTAACGTNTREVGAQTLTTQAQVNALSDVNKINGDLILNPSADLDFSPLSLLTEITGSLELKDNTVQTTLASFDCLTAVKATGFFDGITIRNNTVLVSIEGFPKLATIGSSLRIIRNPILPTIPAFPELTALQNDGLLEIEENNALTSITGFPKLATIGRFLSIIKNPMLPTIPAFPELTALQNNGDLKIEENNALTSITGFPKLATIGRALSIKNNPMLPTIPAFPELTALQNFGVLVIEENNDLTSITGFPKLATIGDSLSIIKNPKLATIPAFPELTALQFEFGDLRIEENNALTSITGFPKLATIGDSLSIIDNAMLASISGLDALTSNGIGGKSTISNNPMLNCQNPEPNFSPVDVSMNNLFDCFTVDTEIVAFARIDASSSLVEDYSYNSDGDISATSTATGIYNVTFSGLTLDGNSNIQVSAESFSFLPEDKYCSVYDVSGNTVIVHCFDASSNSLANIEFTIAIVEQEGATASSTAKIVAYAVADKPNMLSYTPELKTSYNGYGGAITASKTNIGNYSMVFANGTIDSHTNVQVAALDTTLGIFCNIDNWVSTTVNVQCFNSTGALVDTSYSLMVIEETPPANITSKIVGYTRYNDFTNPSFNASGRDVDVTKVGGTSTGRTKIKYTGLDLTNNYHVQVSTRNSIHPNHFCVLADPIITNSSEVNIACYNQFGIAAFTQYNVLVIKK